MSIDPNETWNYEQSPTFHANLQDPKAVKGSVSGPIDKGYFVNPQYPDRWRNAKLKFTRTWPTNHPHAPQSVAIELFVNDIETKMSLSGTTAQSRSIRQFYAHNIELSEIVVTCQARSSYEYSYVAEFIRMTQIHSVDIYESGGTPPLVTFTLDSFGREDMAVKPGNTASNNNNPGTGKFLLAVTYKDPNGNVLRHLPPQQAATGFNTGKRQGFDVRCYITSVSREVKTGNNAYEFQFYATIVDNKSGLFFTPNVTPEISGNEGIQFAKQAIEDVQAQNGFAKQSPQITVGQAPHKDKKGNPAPTPAKTTNVLGSATSTTSYVNQNLNQGHGLF